MKKKFWKKKYILDVFNIFEKVGVEPIKIGSNLDNELNRIKSEKKNKINLNDKKLEENLNKKRFKPIFKENDKKERPRSNNEARGNTLSYEGYYVQNTQKKIEKLFNKEYPNYGINEITNQLIGTIVDKEKNKLKEKKEKKLKKEKEREKGKIMLLASSLSSGNINPKNNDKSNQKSSALNKFKQYVANKLKKKNSFNPNKYEDINNKNNIFSFSKNNKKMTLSPNITNNNLLLLSETTNDNNATNATNNLNNNELNNLTEKTISSNKFKKLRARKTSIISRHNSSFNSIHESSETSKKSQVQNQIKIIEKFNEKLNYKKINKNIINSNKINDNQTKFVPHLNFRKIKKIKPEFRDELLTTRLFRKNFSNNNLSNNTTKNNFYDKTILKFNNGRLPYLYDKIIFKKGETEKLLNYQYYSSSYRSCCETTKQNGINNIPIKTNYKNNWNLVKRFTQQKNKEKINYENKNDNKTFINKNAFNKLITDNISNYITSSPSE